MLGVIPTAQMRPIRTPSLSAQAVLAPSTAEGGPGWFPALIQWFALGLAAQKNARSLCHQRVGEAVPRAWAPCTQWVLLSISSIYIYLSVSSTVKTSYCHKSVSLYVPTMCPVLAMSCLGAVYAF